MKEKPKVGDVLWRVYTVRKGGHGENVEVVAVARKYFTVRPIAGLSGQTEHSIETWKERGDFSRYTLYASERELEDQKESTALQWRIRERLTYGALGLDQLRRIEAILNEKGQS